MTKTVALEQTLIEDGCEVLYRYVSPRVRGIYVADPKAPYIIMRPKQTRVAETSTLAHEAGHHFAGLTGHAGRDEECANRWAVDYLLSPSDIVSATVRGARSYHDLAEMLDLDEDFIRQAVAILDVQFGSIIELEQHILHLQSIWVEDRETGQVWPAE